MRNYFACIAFVLAASSLPAQTAETAPPSLASSWTVGAFEVRQVSWFGGPASRWGALSFQALGPNATSTAFVNVFQATATSTAFDASNAGWLVQNAPIAPATFGRHFTITFDLGPFNPNVTHQVSLAANGVGIRFATTVANRGSIAFGANDRSGRGGGSANPALVGLPRPNGSTRFNLSARGLGIVGGRGMPDVEQGPNESAPSAAANSFAWLHSTSPYVTLPASQDEASEIRDVLKGAAHMATSPSNGTADDLMIQGVLQFIRDHGLPVAVQFRSVGLGDQTRAGLTAFSRPARPTFGWIFEQVRVGRAVEIGVRWAAGSGHWFTVVGAAELLDQQWILYRDSDDGADTVKISLVGTSEPTDPFPGYLELENEASNSVDIAVSLAPLQVVGRACPAGGNAPRILPLSFPAPGNSSFGFLMDGVPPSSTAAFVFASSATTPVSLGGIGFPECDLNVDAKVTIRAPVGPTGAASVALPVPNLPSLLGLRLFTQGIALAPVSPFLFMTRGMAVTVTE